MTTSSYFCVLCKTTETENVCSHCENRTWTNAEIREFFFQTHPRNRPDPTRFYYCGTCNVRNAGTEPVCSTCGITIVDDGSAMTAEVFARVKALDEDAKKKSLVFACGTCESDKKRARIESP